MKFSRRIGAIAICAVALVSITAQAAGVDVSGFVAAHRELFAGLSMLAMTGELDGREVKAALDKINESVKGQVDPLKNTMQELKAQVLALEQKAVRSTDGMPAENDLHEKLRLIAEDGGFEKFRAKATRDTDRFDLGMSIKALVNSGNADSNNTIVPTYADRENGFHGFVLPQLTLMDVLPVLPVGSNKFEFMQLNFTGDAATQLEEGDEKAEMNFDGELVEGKVETIAVHTTASLQVLDDVEGLNDQLDTIMRYKVRAAIERQIMTGSGTGNRMDGIYTQAPLISTSAPNPAERIGEAASEMDTAGYKTNIIIVNPRDWFSIITTKDDQGNYIYGNPQSPAQPTLWNKPVIPFPNIPQGTALVGNTLQVRVRDRMQPTVYMTRDHKDYATRNLVLILVEARAGVALYDRNAFRKVNLSAVSD